MAGSEGWEWTWPSSSPASGLGWDRTAQRGLSGRRLGPSELSWLGSQPRCRRKCTLPLLQAGVATIRDQGSITVYIRPFPRTHPRGSPSCNTLLCPVSAPLSWVQRKRRTQVMVGHWCPWWVLSQPCQSSDTGTATWSGRVAGGLEMTKIKFNSRSVGQQRAPLLKMAVPSNGPFGSHPDIIGWGHVVLVHNVTVFLRDKELCT